MVNNPTRIHFIRSLQAINSLARILFIRSLKIPPPPFESICTKNNFPNSMSFLVKATRHQHKNQLKGKKSAQKNLYYSELLHRVLKD
jgi:hypothetical protein